MPSKLRLRYDGKQTLIAGIVLLAVGMASVLFGIANINKFNSMKEWPVIQADVKQVNEHYKDGYEGSAYKGNTLYIDNYTIYTHFTVDGVTYSRAFDIISYANESRLDVIYNPKDPDEAYLASAPPKSQTYYWLGALAAFIGAPLIIYSFQRKKKRKKKK